MENFTGEVAQPQEMPLQIYLEGNIVVRQGRTCCGPHQAFYDVREERALLLNAEVRARIPGVTGKVRVRAQQLRQTAHDTYHAQHAFITTSEFRQTGISPAGFRHLHRTALRRSRGSTCKAREFDPETGEPIGESTLWATSLNNTFFVENVPVFYFPYLSAPAEDPNIPFADIQFHSDRIFGQAIHTTWDIFKLTGLDRPPGTRWDLNLNYLSLRGPQIGTRGNYRGVGRFGLDGPYQGQGYSSFIYDHGNDNLGGDRLNLIPAQQMARRARLSAIDRTFPRRMILQSEIELPQRSQLARTVPRTGIRHRQGLRNACCTCGRTSTTGAGRRRGGRGCTTTTTRPSGCRAATCSAWPNPSSAGS